MAEAKANLRFVRVTPRKARVVIDMIRGQQVPMALAMLRHTPKHAARVIEKLAGNEPKWHVAWRKVADSEHPAALPEQYRIERFRTGAGLTGGPI